MKVNGVAYRSIWPIGQRSVGIIDQTRLPYELHTLELADWRAMVTAIASMQVRGAPLIGVAYAGAAVAIMINSLLLAGVAKRWNGWRPMLSFAVLYWPVSVSFIMLAGVRHAFRMPVDLRANWLFRTTENQGRREWMSAVERFVMGYVIAPIHLVTLPFAILRPYRYAVSQGPLVVWMRTLQRPSYGEAADAGAAEVIAAVAATTRAMPYLNMETSLGIARVAYRTAPGRADIAGNPNNLNCVAAFRNSDSEVGVIDDPPGPVRRILLGGHR